MGQPIRFSERERQVIKLLLQGKSNKEIALALGVAQRTVEFHLSHIYSKLGVTSRTEAALQLSKTDLRESAVADLRETTVPPAHRSDHNVAKSIFMKWVSMNKSSIIGIGILVLTSVFCVGSLYSMALERDQPSGSVVELIPTSSESATSTALISIPPAENLPPTNEAIPSHTVNGYTAAIESYYVDLSHVIFQVRITGGRISFGDQHFYDRIGGTDLYDENGNVINTSGGIGPAVDPALYQFEFVPVTLLKGDRLKGQFVFDIRDAPDDYNRILAQFRFDIDLPIYPEARFYPKQTVTSNGLEMLLDSVTVTPVFTQAYLCFSPPSYVPWTPGSQTILQMNGQEAILYNDKLLFDSDLGGDKRAGSEPYWVPPTKNGRCMKIGFAIGSREPTSFILTIPELESLEPDVLLTDQLLTNYPGLNEKEAYQTYLEEHDKTYKGPWLFRAELTP